MRIEEAFYNISMYLYNKNVLEYAHITRNETESKIPYIQDCSIIYSGYQPFSQNQFLPKFHDMGFRVKIGLD